MSKKLRNVIIIVVVVAAIAGGYYIVQQRNAATQASEDSQVVLATVERGSVEAVVVATGSLAPERSESITFSTSGTVASVLIEDGAFVTEGQVLATLDDSTLELNLASARVALSSAEAQLARTIEGASDDSITAAQASLAAAQATLNALYEGPTDEQIHSAELQIDQAKNSLWAAQAARDAAAGNPLASSSSIDQAEAQVLNAEVGVELAQLQYDQLFTEPNETTIKSAELQVAQARANLSSLLSSPSAEEIQIAEASVEQARISVQLLENQLDDLELTAAFDGYVEGWDVNVSDLVTPSVPLATLIDNSAYHINVYIDESEIGQIDAGQNANIEVDSFSGQIIKGIVESIDLVGTSAQGIVTYGVRVNLESTDLALRPQLTSSVYIITSTKDDVLLVSNRALRRDSDGKYVEVLGTTSVDAIYLETGLVGDDYTEIISGLDEGDEYIVSRPESFTFEGPFGVINVN